MLYYKIKSLITLSICMVIKLYNDIILKHTKLIYKHINYFSYIMKLIT